MKKYKEELIGSHCKFARKWVVATLNRLFWKISITQSSTNTGKANFILAELEDAGLDGIFWDYETEEFKLL